VKMHDSRKKICLRIVVSYENHSRMQKDLDAMGQPLFALRKNQQYSLKFEHKTITASFQKQKKVYSVKQIVKAETVDAGVRILLADGCCIGIAAENTEKHNTTLFDIVLWLKRYCGRRFSGKTPIVYPVEEDSGRYKSRHVPQQQLPFSLTDGEIRKILLYQLLIQKRGILFAALTVFLLTEAAVLGQIGILVMAAGFLTLGVIIGLLYFRSMAPFVQNHQGQLYLLQYETCLVVRLQVTDLELEYGEMKSLPDMLGLWRLQSGRFYTLLLPKRLKEENPYFFEALENKRINAVRD